VVAADCRTKTKANKNHFSAERVLAISGWKSESYQLLVREEVETRARLDEVDRALFFSLRDSLDPHERCFRRKADCG